MTERELLEAWLSFEDTFIAACTSHDYIEGCRCNGCTLYRLIKKTKKAVK